jgi:hypothetical protein
MRNSDGELRSVIAAMAVLLAVFIVMAALIGV